MRSPRRKALCDYEADPEVLARKAMQIAAEVCVFTNDRLTIENGRRMNDNLTPKAIVAALDEHIVGQNDAKKAVAVALRNRWRRQRLSPELREEVTPKNILMIGPTGCGKTEISRRLAKLADAPFVKVEATKFTEVGYVGRDVEQIARDLVEEAVRLERERRREKVREASRGRGDGAAARRADRQGIERGDPRQLPPALRRRQPRQRRGRDRGRRGAGDAVRHSRQRRRRHDQPQRDDGQGDGRRRPRSGAS